MQFNSVLFVLLTVRNCFGAVPDLYWSFEADNGDSISPNNLNASKWTGDLSDLKDASHYHTGVKGNSLKVDNEILFSQRLSNNDCVYDVDSCSNGLSFTFWLKITKWSPTFPYNTIIRTANSGMTVPGIYIGDDEQKTQMKFFVYRKSGTKILAIIPLPTLDKWLHIGMVWNEEDIKLYINGSLLADSQYATTPQNETVTAYSFLANQKLTLGSYSTIYFLDELKVYYHPISANDVALDAYLEADTTTKSTTTETTTTTRTTTANPLTMTPPVSWPQTTCKPCICATNAKVAKPFSQLEIVLVSILCFFVLLLLIAIAIVLYRGKKKSNSTNERNYNGVNYSRTQTGETDQVKILGPEQEEEE